MSAQNLSLSKILPASLNGWELSGTEKVYTPETLYDYIDGGAELYLSYGMKDVVSLVYSKENVGTIRIEVFDLVNSKNAFGVFTHTRMLDEKEFGQGSQYFTGAQIFWKDKYLVTIIADDENADIKETIKKFASIIESQITSEGNLPEILSLLPAENLVTDGYCYFHHYIWQNIYYFISNENILSIDDSTDAIIARYGEKDKRTLLLIIEYSDSLKAEKSYESFQHAFFKNDSSIHTAELDDFTWLAGMRSDNFLIAVFKSSSEYLANEYLLKVLENIKNIKSKTIQK